MASAVSRCSLLSAVALYAVVCACQAAEPKIERDLVFAERPGEQLLAFLDRESKADREKPAADQAKPTAKAPEPDWGAIFKMHYQSRVKMFTEQNLVFKNVVLVGDSITEGFDVATYFPGRRILNRGIGADVIGNDLPADDPRGVLKRLEQSIFDCAPTDVFLMIGINDLNSGRTPEVLEKGYRELFQQIKAGAPRVRVHVQSILPTRGSHAARNPDVLDSNARLKKLAAEFGFNYIDLHSRMIDAKGELKSEFTEDGLHLTPAAYAVWQAEVLRIIDETRPPAPPN
jgi:lysophospholipase L1-like esterase